MAESKYDWDLIAKLIDIVDGTRDYPKLKTIHHAAMAQLDAINAAPVDEPRPTPQPTSAQPNIDQPEPVITQDRNGRRI